MTDETIEQIERDATEYMVKEYGQSTGFPEADTIRDNGKFDFSQGATHQHPISYAAGKKDGINETIEAVLKEVARYKDLFEYSEDYVELVKELEALKTEIKK